MFDAYHRGKEDPEFANAEQVQSLVESESGLWNEEFWLCSLLAEGNALDTQRLYEETDVVMVYQLYAARELHRYYAEKRWKDGTSGSDDEPTIVEFPYYDQIEQQKQES